MKHKEKLDFLSSKKKIINELLIQNNSNFYIGFQFVIGGNKSIYKVEKESFRVIGNVGNFITFNEIKEFLEGFHQALTF